MTSQSTSIKDDENFMQIIYQIISTYFEDDCADELTLEPVFNAILGKNGLYYSLRYQDFLTVSAGHPPVVR